LYIDYNILPIFPATENPKLPRFSQQLFDLLRRLQRCDAALAHGLGHLQRQTRAVARCKYACKACAHLAIHADECAIHLNARQQRGKRHRLAEDEYAVKGHFLPARHKAIGTHVAGNGRNRSAAHLNAAVQRSIRLAKGTQLVDGQKAIDIVTYPKYPGKEPARAEMTASLAVEIINRKLSLAACAGADQLFKSVINRLETNITFLDFEERRTLAAAMESLSPAFQIYPDGVYDAAGESYVLTEDSLRMLRAYFGR
jgi:hypothetical protein